MQMSSNRIMNQRQAMTRQANPQMRAGQNTTARPTSSLSDYGQARRPAVMSEGQLIRGEVTDLRNNEIEITLEDNTILAAHIEDGTMLSIGDTAAFRVTDTTGGVITVRAIPKTELLQEMTTIYKALEEAGLPKNDKNIELVRSLMREGLAINQQTIMNSMRLNYQYPEVSISTLLQLEKYGLPITAQNAASFEALKDGAFHMETQLVQLTDTLSELLAEGSFRDAKEIADLLSVISPTAKELQKTTLTPLQMPPVLSEREQGELLDILSNFQDTEAVQQQLEQGKLTLQDTARIILDCMDQAMQLDEKNAMSAEADFETEEEENPAQQQTDGAGREAASLFRNLFQRLTKGETEAALHKETEPALDIPKTIELFDHPVIQRLLEQYHSAQGEASMPGILTSGELKLLGSAVEQLDPASVHGKELAAQLRQGKLSIPEFMGRLRELFYHMTENPIREPELLFGQPAFTKVLRQAFLLSATLSPKEISQKGTLSECYQETDIRMEQLERLLRMPEHGNSPAAERLLGQAAQLRSDLSFLNSMEEVFRYIQLPLRQNQKMKQAELFVYTRKDAIAEHPERLSVLLHLEPEHLGPLDIHLSLKRHQVEAVFYPAKEEQSGLPGSRGMQGSTEKLLSGHMDQLAGALEKKGFQLTHRIETSEYLKKEEPSKSFGHFLKEQSGTGTKRRYSFDIRA